MQNESKNSNQVPTQETEKYSLYLRYEMEYREKINAFNKAYATAQGDPLQRRNWPFTGKKYKGDIDRALKTWEELGFKKEIDAVLQKVDLELHLKEEEE